MGAGGRVGDPTPSLAEPFPAKHRKTPSRTSSHQAPSRLALPPSSPNRDALRVGRQRRVENPSHVGAPPFPPAPVEDTPDAPRAPLPDFPPPPQKNAPRAVCFGIPNGNAGKTLQSRPAPERLISLPPKPAKPQPRRPRQSGAEKPDALIKRPRGERTLPECRPAHLAPDISSA